MAVGQVTKGRALMTAQDIAEGNAPTNHSLRVNWFHREPGGSTIFVMPPAGDGAAAQPVAERDDGTAT
ncbi:MAG: hypothetical protein DLM62_17800 [Pseudonocardiales bacterium]|nr:MAG: hypothetical protein DLM62_17800 [Pseudonocardiales bacterium]